MLDANTQKLLTDSADQIEALTKTASAQAGELATAKATIAELTGKLNTKVAADGETAKSASQRAKFAGDLLFQKGLVGTAEDAQALTTKMASDPLTTLNVLGNLLVKHVGVPKLASVVEGGGEGEQPLTANQAWERHIPAAQKN